MSVLLVFNFLISLITFSIDTFKKMNFSPIITFLIEPMLGCFLYLILSARGSVPLHSGIIKFLIALKNKLFKTVGFLSTSLTKGFLMFSGGIERDQWH